MCGIIGLINEKFEISEELLLGLNSIQHRGQDACGVITSELNEVFIKKHKGTVNELQLNVNPKSLKGKMGIAHTRYPTIGSSQDVDAQPLFVNSSKKVSMAHNGNVTNYFDLDIELKKKGLFLSTKIDIEPILRIFAIEYEKNQDFFKAVEVVLNKVKGSYSVVGMIGDKGLFAFRDPNGIRPLVLGRREDAYIFASESVVLQTLGYEYVRDVEPGEAILISHIDGNKNNGNDVNNNIENNNINNENNSNNFNNSNGFNNKLKFENKIIFQKQKAHCMFEWIYFARPDSMIEKRAVYKARLALGKAIAKKIDPKDVDVVIPVPDTARSSAIKIAEELGVKYREGLIKNRYVGRTFIMGSQKLREQSVSIKLNPIISEIEGKSIIVVDDSIVRGTTSKKIISIIRKAKPKKIIFVSICPMIKYPCYYGVDFPTKEELIASKKDVEAIREYIGADELIFGDIEDVKDMIKRPLCCACLDGKYPTDITEEQKKLIGNDNINYRKGENNLISYQNKKNVLIIGSGGREHSIAMKVFESSNVKKIFAIPGNPGIAKIAECYDIDINNNQALVDFAIKYNIDLTIVGPEVPLANGIVDDFKKNHLRIFGPNKKAAKFESSKIFSKNFMKKYNLPTAEFEIFTNYDDAKTYLENKEMPIVIKADGLAAGKGVCVAQNLEEALIFAKDCLENNKFGDASSKIIIEEFLEGEEASYLMFIDSNVYKPMVISQDHKQIYENDKGPNTGGMGAYSPANILKDNKDELKLIMDNFFKGIKEEKIFYSGVLYIGFIKTKNGLKVLEFNCRFGDPETQVILPRLKTDFIEIIEAVIDKKLNEIEIHWNEEICATVVLASEGYPNKYEKGFEITGLDKIKNCYVIHAGTKIKNNILVTNGGRVLNIVGKGNNLKETLEKIYKEIKKINFKGMYFRKDIGFKRL